MTAIADRGYRHPDALVSTDWVAAHAGRPRRAHHRVERRHAALRLRPRARRRARRLDRRPQRPAAPRLHRARRLREADGEDRRHPRHHRGLLRRQEQLVGVLRLLGVPALRPHQGPRDGRRPAEVAEGRPAWSTDTPSYPATTYKAPERDDVTTPHPARRSASSTRRRAGSSSTCAAPRSTPARACTCPSTPTKARSAAATSRGAKSIPWAKAINPDDGTFKTADELTALYVKEKGLDGAKDIVAYCRIGERSSHTWFALTYLLGFDKVRNYDGSWTEWGNLVGVPIEK